MRAHCDLTVEVDLTWGVLGNVIEGLRLRKIDGRVYGGAGFMYTQARVERGLGYLAPGGTVNVEGYGA